MTTPNDKQFLTRMGERLKAETAPTDVASYRSFLHRMLEDLKNSEPLPQVGAYHKDVDLGSGLRADIAVPAGEGPFPVVLICHGNGGLAGSAQSYRRFTRDMAVHGFVAVTPDYRLAPEHRHPAAIMDMVAAAHWIRDSIGRFGGDANRTVLLGDSSGAGMALAALLKLREEPSALQFRAFVGLEGAYDRLTPSFITQAYMPEGYTEEDARSPLASPVLAISRDMALPPIILLTGSDDMTAARTLMLANKLVETKHSFALHLLEDMPHDFMKFPALDGYKEGHRLVTQFLAQYVGE